MHKTSFKIPILLGLIIGVSAVSFFVYSTYENTAFEPRVAEITITKAEFIGISGLENNGVILYLENNNKVIDVTVKDVCIFAEGFNRTFSVSPEENDYPTRSQGQITLTNVGWTKNVEYKLWVLTHDGMVCGAFHKTS